MTLEGKIVYMFDLGMHRFSKNLGTTSEFWGPAG